MDQLVPLQNRKELDSMIKNATRDLSALKDFVMKEKNVVIRLQLEQILVSSWDLARRFDGCQKVVLESEEFRKECRKVFLLISAQKRGGRKLFMNVTSCPVNGLNKVHFIWWSTVRGYQGSTLKFMDDFIADLAKPTNPSLSDSAISAGAHSDDSIDMSDPLWCKNRLLKDVARIISDKVDQTGDLSGFGIGSSFNDNGNKNCFLLTITLIPRDDSDSDVGDISVGDRDTGAGNQNGPKREIPFQGMIPKSESSRLDAGLKVETAPPLPKPASPQPMEVDEDGFWTSYDRVLPLSAAKEKLKGEIVLLLLSILNRNQYHSITVILNLLQVIIDDASKQLIKETVAQDIESITAGTSLQSGILSKVYM